jgi:hypothetical protein
VKTTRARTRSAEGLPAAQLSADTEPFPAEPAAVVQAASITPATLMVTAPTAPACHGRIPPTATSGLAISCQFDAGLQGPVPRSRTV